MFLVDAFQLDSFAGRLDGLDELRSYERKNLQTDKPSFQQLTRHPRHESYGHDLQAVPSSKALVVTTGLGVHLFDRDSGKFRPHPDLAKKERDEMH